MLKIRYIAACLALVLAMGLVGCDRGNMPDVPDATPGADNHTGSDATPGTDASVVPDTAPSVTVPSEPVVGEVDEETLTGGTANPGLTVGDSAAGDAAGTTPGGSADHDTNPETVGGEPADAPTAGTVDGTSAATIVTLGESVTVTGAGVTVTGTTVTVTNAGTYIVTGTLADGQLVIDTADSARVTVVLNGASLTCSSGPAVYVKAAEKKVVFRTARGSVNLLADAAGYVVADEDQVEGEVYPNACLYACADVEFDGEGELYVTGNADKGINTKDDLTLSGGTLTVSAAGVGIRANDSLTVSGGTVTVQSKADGIKTANTEKEGKGFISISGGTVYVTAQGDALSAATDLSVVDGTLVLNTLNESGAELTESTGNTGGASGGMGGGNRPGGMGGRPGRPGESTSAGSSSTTNTTYSAKGIKAAGELVIGGGKITIVAQDDGLHSNTNLTVSGGTTYIRAADDGMHADGELVISGGVNEVAQSYEGLEALHITITGGTNRITASDDGANASDGSGSMGMGGGFGGGFGGWGSSGTITETADQPCLTFSGGYSVFHASGDGIDSNGWIKMTGGTVVVYGPTNNGNGPIDTGDGGYNMTVSGGTFLAVGSAGMAESAENAGQAVLAARWSVSAGSTIGIVDADGQVLAAFELPKVISSIVFSSSDIEAGSTYTLVTGGTFSGNATDGIIDPATYTGYTSQGEIEAS